MDKFNDKNLSKLWIHAKKVKLTIIDDEDGKTYERELPLEYYENSNSVMLKGEDCKGNPSEIVFIPI